MSSSAESTRNRRHHLQRADDPGQSNACAYEIKRLAGRGVAAMVIRQASAIAINLMGTIVLSRLLGPFVWGLLAIPQTMYTASREILGRGIATSLIRQSRTPSESDVRHIFAIQHLAGTVFLFVALCAAHPAAAWYGHPELFPLMLAAGVASYLYSWRGVSIALLERTFEYIHVGRVEILEAATFNTVAILFALCGHTFAGLGVAILLRGALPSALAFLLKPVHPSIHFKWQATRVTVDFGLFMAISSLINVALLSVPAVFVGKLAGAEALGLAQMAFALYGSFLFATAAVLRLGLSTYSRLADFPGQLDHSVSQHLEMLAIFLVPAIVLFAGCSRIWVPWTLGAKWQALPGLLAALAPGYFLASVFWGVLSPAMLALGRHRILVVWLTAITITYGGLTWMLTRWWNAIGVAAAFSFSQIFWLPALFRIVRQTDIRLRHQVTFRELLFGTGFLAVLWWASGESLTLAAMASLMVLGLTCWRNYRRLHSLKSAVVSLW